VDLDEEVIKNTKGEEDSIIEKKRGTKDLVETQRPQPVVHSRPQPWQLSLSYFAGHHSNHSHLIACVWGAATGRFLALQFSVGYVWQTGVGPQGDLLDAHNTLSFILYICSSKKHPFLVKGQTSPVLPKHNNK